MITIPGKIPIRIHPVFWFLILVIGWINSGTWAGTGIWAVIIFLSVLIHEYGHALTARAFGQDAAIDLVALGGLTSRSGPKLSLWKEFLIVFNGPLAGFMLFVASYNMLLYAEPKSSSLWVYALKITAAANLFWTIINLLPVHPLDGGRLLSIILESIFGLRGLQASLLFSGILAAAFAGFLFYLQSLLAGAIFLLLAFESYKGWKMSLSMTSGDQDNELVTLFQSAEKDLEENRQREAIDKFEQIRKDTSNKGILNLNATEQLAKIYSKEGLVDKTYELLHPLQSILSPESLKLLHAVAYQTKHWKEAIEVGARAYTAFPEYQTALINSLSYAKIGEVKPSVGWLQRAISDGLPNPKSAFHREEYDAIRTDLTFQDLERRIT